MRFVAVYLVSALGASLLSILWNPNGLSVGASGAILGLMGAELGFILLTWNQSDPAVRKQLLIQTLLWVVIVFVASFSSTIIDSAAHAGGFLTGFVFIFIVFYQRFEHPTIKGVYLLVAAAVVLLAYFGAGFGYFFSRS